MFPINSNLNVMSINKTEIMQLSNDEKRQIAFELLDSIDEEFIEQQLPDWKKQLIRERIDLDDRNPEETTTWRELRNKFLSR